MKTLEQSPVLNGIRDVGKTHLTDGSHIFVSDKIEIL